MKFHYQTGSTDERPDALADVRGRKILRFLSDQPDNAASVDELVRHINSRSRTDGTSEREQTEVELQHTHIPLLADRGLVEYDVRNGRVPFVSDRTTEKLLELLSEFE